MLVGNSAPGNDAKPAAGERTVPDTPQVTSLHGELLTQLRDYILKQRNFAGISGTYDFVTRADNRGIDPLSSPIVRWDKASGEFANISKPGGLPL